MDVVVVTYGPDLKLLRHMVRSYDLYFKGKDSLIVVTDRRDWRSLEQIDFPSNTVLAYRQDYPEVANSTGNVQGYLKLRAHELTKTDYFLLVDSDFVFLHPVSDEHFFHAGRPVWFQRRWAERDASIRWRPVSERFLGRTTETNYGDHAQWLMSRALLEQMDRELPIPELLELKDVHEFLVYGAYAHAQGGPYLFVDRDDQSPVTQLSSEVNQRPPTYCILDPACRYEDFAQYKYVQFWSHWELAEAKMVEFFEASQRHNFGQVIAPSKRAALPVAVRYGPVRREDHRYFGGLWSDLWINGKLEFWLNGSPGQEVALDLEVPHNPDKRSWRLEGTIAIADLVPESFSVEPGLAEVRFTLPQQIATDFVPVRLLVATGFTSQHGADPRELSARLLEVRPINSSDEAEDIGTGANWKTRTIEFTKLQRSCPQTQYAGDELIEPVLGDRGILYVAFGAKCVDEASVSAELAKRHMPNMPVALVTDSTLSPPFIDEVIRVDTPWINRLSKPQHLLRSPFRRTLAIDTDTRFCAPVYELFDLMNRFPLALCHDQVRARRHPAVPAYFCELNAGVLVYSCDAEARALLARWAALCATELQNPTHSSNQIVLEFVLYDSRARFAVIPPEYNCFFDVPMVVNGKVKILHGHADLQAAERRINSNPHGVRIFHPDVWPAGSNPEKRAAELRLILWEKLQVIDGLATALDERRKLIHRLNANLRLASLPGVRRVASWLARRA